MLTEVAVKDEEGSDIEQQAEQFTDDHEIVPRTNSQRNHQQLGQDESRERDRHDVDEVVVKQQKRSKHYDSTCKRPPVHTRALTQLFDSMSH